MSRESKHDLTRRLLYVARLSGVATERFDERARRALGINRTDATCVDLLDNEGAPVSAGRLAELSGLTTAAITAVVDRLERKGYVRRMRDERDRRRVMIELTPLLQERIAAIWGPVGEEGSRLLERFTLDQLRTVISYFELSRELNERHAERIRALRLD